MRLPILLTVALALVACSPSAEAPAEKAPATEAAAAQEPVMPADAPPQEDAVLPAAAETSCILDQGSDGAIALAERCVAVSPASHPPCNPENPCKLMTDEIERACAQYPAGQKPAQCAG